MVRTESTDRNPSSWSNARKATGHQWSISCSCTYCQRRTPIEHGSALEIRHSPTHNNSWISTLNWAPYCRHRCNYLDAFISATSFKSCCACSEPCLDLSFLLRNHGSHHLLRYRYAHVLDSFRRSERPLWTTIQSHSCSKNADATNNVFCHISVTRSASFQPRRRLEIP